MKRPLPTPIRASGWSALLAVLALGGAVSAQQTVPPPGTAPPMTTPPPASTPAAAPAKEPADEATTPTDSDAPGTFATAAPDTASDTPIATDKAPGSDTASTTTTEASKTAALTTVAAEGPQEIATDEHEKKTEAREHLKLFINGHKIWLALKGAYELHSNVISDDYSGNDVFGYYMLQCDANLTEYDTVSVYADLEQRYTADPGEAGLFFGDMRFYYSRKFVLPIPKFAIPAKASVYLTAPTSRASQGRDYITKPTAILKLVPSWWKLSLAAQWYFTWAIAKYAETGDGSQSNAQFITGYDLQLSWQALEWLAPYAGWRQGFQKPYETREGKSQPWRPSYAYELGVDFTIPTPEAFPIVDVVLAWDQGSNLLSDGVYRSYFAKRDQSEIYLGINLVF